MPNDTDTLTATINNEPVTVPIRPMRATGDIFAALPLCIAIAEHMDGKGYMPLMETLAATPDQAFSHSLFLPFIKDLSRCTAPLLTIVSIATGLPEETVKAMDIGDFVRAVMALVKANADTISKHLPTQ